MLNKITTSERCKKCGAFMILHIEGDKPYVDARTGPCFDMILTCEHGCKPVLNAFVPIEYFHPVE